MKTNVEPLYTNISFTCILLRLGNSSNKDRLQGKSMAKQIIAVAEIANFNNNLE